MIFDINTIMRRLLIISSLMMILFPTFTSSQERGENTNPLCYEEVGKGVSQMCYDSSLTPIMNAPLTWRNFRKPIAEIRVHYPTCDSVGTGFLYDDCCLVTAWHVIRSATNPASIEIWFGYEDTIPPYVIGTGCTPDIWECCYTQADPNGYDIGKVYIKKKNGKCPGRSGYGKLQISAIGPQQGDGVYIIGHPWGRCKEYSHDSYATIKSNGTDPQCPQGQWSHGADTQPGSSGSPVFDDAGKVIGIHTGSDGQNPCKNCFVPTAVVYNFLTMTSCPCEPDTIPTLSEWGFVILAVLIVLSAWLVMRKRKLFGIRA
jgi:V8-like Glu-specific endopeptidase